MKLRLIVTLMIVSVVLAACAPPPPANGPTEQLARAKCPPNTTQLACVPVGGPPP
ncbi:MAG TPA: hypothetical protein VMJ90_04350 [Anaerolineales bacterium]|nr:hypothetical protein [Anaerolineales bacterium]